MKPILRPDAHRALLQTSLPTVCMLLRWLMADAEWNRVKVGNPRAVPIEA